MSDLPVDHYMSNHNDAARAVADRLHEGTLTMLLGAGVSKGMNLPSWWELVKSCCEAVGVDGTTVNESTSNERLRALAEKIENEAGDFATYRDKVRQALYRNAKEDCCLLDQKLLIVIGAMLMDSRRGNVRELVTFNFDDMLERYLSLHGFIYQTTTELPVLQHDVDVTIHHPHGFLLSSPHVTAEDSDFLVFSQYSYDERIGQDNLWKTLTRDLLLRKVGLFVGLSCHDPVLGPLLVDLKKTTNGDRVLGYWLLGPGDDDESLAFLTARNVVPIKLDSYEDYHLFLLTICQYAAR